MPNKDSASSEPEPLDVKGAATLAGRHPETVRRWIWSGRLPAHRRGNRLFVSREDVEALGDGEKAPVTLSEWAARARAARQAAPSSGPPRSAADLVIEDRTRRSLPEA